MRALLAVFFIKLTISCGTPYAIATVYEVTSKTDSLLVSLYVDKHTALSNPFVTDRRGNGEVMLKVKRNAHYRTVCVRGHVR